MRELETEFKNVPIEQLDILRRDWVAVFLAVNDPLPHNLDDKRLKSAAILFERLIEQGYDGRLLAAAQPVIVSFRESCVRQPVW